MLLATIHTYEENGNKILHKPSISIREVKNVFSYDTFFVIVRWPRADVFQCFISKNTYIWGEWKQNIKLN